MAEPGIVERGLDALRRNRPSLQRKIDRTVGTLGDESEKAERRHNLIRYDAEDLARRVDNTRPELVAAAGKHGESVRQVVCGAFETFSTTVADVVGGLRDARAHGTARAMEDALRKADQVMHDARHELRMGLESAETMLPAARASLTKLQATTAPGDARPKLHGRAAPTVRAQRSRLSRSTSQASLLRRAAPEPKGKGRT